MLEYFIHSPAFCCMLGGLTVPIAQRIEFTNASQETRIRYRVIGFVGFLGSVAMYMIIGAVSGYVFFEDYDPALKTRYFSTGLVAPFCINRMFATARDLLSRIKVTVNNGG